MNIDDEVNSKEVVHGVVLPPVSCVVEVLLLGSYGTAFPSGERGALFSGDCLYELFKRSSLLF